MFMGEARLPRELYFSLDYEINPIHVVELDFVFGFVSYFFLVTDSIMVKAYAVGLSMRLVKGPLVGLCFLLPPNVAEAPTKMRMGKARTCFGCPLSKIPPWFMHIRSG